MNNPRRNYDPDLTNKIRAVFDFPKMSPSNRDGKLNVHVRVFYTFSCFNPNVPFGIDKVIYVVVRLKAIPCCPPAFYLGHIALIHSVDRCNDGKDFPSRLSL